MPSTRLQDVEPVDHRRRRPVVGREGDRAEHLRAAPGRSATAPRSRRACARRGRPRRPELALDPAFDERRRPPSIASRAGGGQLEAGLVRRREQVGGEPVAAARRVAGARREVAGQAVAVEVGRQRVGDAGPELGVASGRPPSRSSAPGRRRVGLEVAAHARQARRSASAARATSRPPRLTPRRAAAASAGAATGSVNVPSSCASVACSTRTGTAGDDELRHLERGPCALASRSSAAASQAMLNASAGTLTGQTTSFARAGGEHHVLRRQGDRHARRCSAPPRPAGWPCPAASPRTFISRAVVLRSVSMRAELVAVAHQRRQAGEHLQVLRDADAGAAGAELLRARRRRRRRAGSW